MTEGFAYLLMAAALTGVLLYKTRTRLEQIAAAIMIFTLVIGGLDAVINEFPSEFVVPAMVIGLCLSILALIVDRLENPPDPSGK